MWLLRTFQAAILSDILEFVHNKWGSAKVFSGFMGSFGVLSFLNRSCRESFSGQDTEAGFHTEPQGQAEGLTGPAQWCPAVIQLALMLEIFSKECNQLFLWFQNHQRLDRNCCGFRPRPQDSCVQLGYHRDCIHEDKLELSHIVHRKNDPRRLVYVNNHAFFDRDEENLDFRLLEGIKEWVVYPEGEVLLPISVLNFQ